MTNLKSKKQLITEAILKELSDDELDIDKVLFDWWFTGRQEGLRLTDAGMKALQKAQIEYYDHEFKQDAKSIIDSHSYYSFISTLSKKIKCPYYLGVNKIENKKTFYIRLYDSKIAMMVKLYGNLQEYLESIKEKR